MAAKRLVVRPRALLDVEEAVDYLFREASARTALGFIDALHSAYGLISDYPQSGSGRYALELRLPGLRCLKLNRYPYLVFYMERDDHLDVWRVLQAQRDVPSGLRDEL